jgi:cyclic lactone autoinducer peptide
MNKKVSKVILITSGIIVSGIVALAAFSVSASACWWTFYQPEIPKKPV